MKIQSVYPFTLSLEDPETGEVQDVRVRIARMAIEQASTFRRDFYRSANPASAALVARKPDGPEQETRVLVDRFPTTTTPELTREVFIVDDETIRARRLAEMTPEQRDAFDAMEAAEEAFSIRFLSGAIAAYVTVEPGQLSDDEGPIETGADVLRAFGARADVLRTLLVAIQAENALSPSAKKVLRSLSAFGRGSHARPSGAAGPTPAATAAAVATAASAPIAAASAPATSLSSCSSDAPAMETTA